MVWHFEVGERNHWLNTVLQAPTGRRKTSPASLGSCSSPSGKMRVQAMEVRNIEAHFGKQPNGPSL